MIDNSPGSPDMEDWNENWADYYGPVGELIYNGTYGRLLGRALLFAHQNMPNLSLEDDRMLGALARQLLDTAEELEGR